MLRRSLLLLASVAVVAIGGGAIALAIAATADVIPPPRLGAGAQALLVMVYSADRGTIVSGYQASSLARIRIGENAIWLP